MENLIKPKLLDLYCCGGGAGRGYELAGFDVTGLSIWSSMVAIRHNNRLFASLRIAAIVGQVELGSTPNKLTILHN